MTRRTLILLTLLLALYPSLSHAFVVARVDTFQQGVKPDANYAGCSDALIRATTIGGGTDTLNYGGGGTLIVGPSLTTSGRVLIKFDFGTYLPTTAIVDSAFLDLYVTAVATVDTLLAYPVLMNWVEGSGTGQANEIAGVTWKSFGAVTLVGDSLWGKVGADSGKTAFISVQTYQPSSQRAVGTLTFNTNEDRTGYYYVLGTYTNGTNAYKSFNVTDLLKFSRECSVPGAGNYGWLLRTFQETFAASHRLTISSSEAGGNEPRLRVYSHDIALSVHMGDSNTGIHQ